ncbi:hypothetical protein GCM10011386_25240 [Parapedobacter defluvii]|uniref:Lipoprotein n=1 Tax=Parapedobacter defluvii TaxID=2045106 RepID=A0ABQ1LZ03_9SPHI|nr:hypothetical protein [Parapedobacter defluvii]RQP20001.1 MAG: hypothetical protein EAS52_00605 [Parapedobacter sp.]GGC32080.1 hypothetical protein GCM10011386_25240 [Parapedobacter defluvii]
MKQIKTFVTWLGIGGACLTGSCAAGGGVEKPTETTSQYDTLSLLGDRSFEQGLVRKRADAPSPGTIQPFGTTTLAPIWEMAEWGTKYELEEGDKEIKNDGWVSYANDGKAIAFAKDGDNIRVAMDVYASAEYESPRQPNQAWPHLLIEQAFPEKPYVKDLEGLVLKFKGQLTKAEMKMNQGDFDPGLHTAQFQLFITVQDLNPNSAHYGDYLWFGIPFYDYRYEEIPLYAAQDVGKGDATGKFIYSAGSADFMEGSFQSGNWITLEKDIYPLIVDALKLAKERGYLTGSFFEDFQISGMNLGWEVPGTFDVGFQFNGFDLLAVTKRK